MAAEPAIEKRVEKMVSNHRWVPAGYKVCCTGDYVECRANTLNRRSSAICPSYRRFTCCRAFVVSVSRCNGRCIVNFINVFANISLLVFTTPFSESA